MSPRGEEEDFDDSMFLVQEENHVDMIQNFNKAKSDAAALKKSQKSPLKLRLKQKSQGEKNE